jgi:death-on-curing protein
MEGAGKALKVPTIDDLVQLNRRLINEYGGGFYSGTENFLNRGTLEHALAQIQYSLFGIDAYPTIFEKAALLAWRIIAGHVFNDGNKRTGMATALVFLRANGYSLMVSSETVKVALQIATQQMSIVELTAWLEKQTTQINE